MPARCFNNSNQLCPHSKSAETGQHTDSLMLQSSTAKSAITVYCIKAVHCKKFIVKFTVTYWQQVIYTVIAFTVNYCTCIYSCGSFIVKCIYSTDGLLQFFLQCQFLYSIFVYSTVPYWKYILTDCLLL